MKLHALLVNEHLVEAKTHFEKYRFLQSPDDIVYNEGILNSVIKKDLRELIYSYELALKDDPYNLYLLHSLSKYYTCILLDRNKSLHYSKRIFEIDTTDSRYIVDKLNNFYYNKQFEEATKILQDTALMDVLNPFQKIAMTQDYYAFQDNYEKAQLYLEQLKPLNLTSYYSNKTWLYSKKGDSKTTYEVFNRPEYKPLDNMKVLCFAHLKETDSLFHYLHKISNYAKLDYRVYSFMEINGSSAIDPYRNDPRYIDIMKENYFPLEGTSN